MSRDGLLQATTEHEGRAATLARTLAGSDPTMVRSPRATVTPSSTRGRGKRALEVLRGLADVNALVEEGVLGQGGMGVVMLARQVALDRQVAVKTLKPGVAREEDVEALLSEAWLTGALEHPGILPVYALTRRADGQPALVMKRIEGRTWARLLDDAEALAAVAPGRSPLEAHVRIVIQVCNALHFAHSRGVVHRDLKPDNVMVGAFGEVYLVDWGIATEPGPSAQLAGTPAYMAPEMLGEGGVISARTDVYLLGAVLHEVVTGRPPHGGEGLQAVLQSVLASRPALPPEAPAELAELLTRCLSADPAQRPASALEVRLALEAFLEHQGSRELSTQSEARLEALLAALADARAAATTVAALFSQCRFGFQQALRSWPENVTARRGLERALVAMVRHELRQGTARAAQGLLAELAAPPADLAAEVASALARDAAREAEVALLQDLARKNDPRTGEVRRLVTALVLISMWVVSPLIGHFVAGGLGPLENLAPLPVAVLSTLALIIAKLRAPKEHHTTLNTQLARLLLFTMPFQALMHVALYTFEVDLGVRQVPLLLGYWAFVASLATILFERRIWPTPLAYWLSAAGALAWPQWRYLFGVAGNLGLFLNILVLLLKQRRAAARGVGG